MQDYIYNKVFDTPSNLPVSKNENNETSTTGLKDVNEKRKTLLIEK